MRTAVSFSVFILGVCLCGFIIGDVEEVRMLSSFYTAQGVLRYETVFQGFGATFLVSLVNVVLEDPAVGKNMLVLWKIVIKLVLSFFITLGFIIYFDWFAITNVHAWIGFIVSFSSCIVIATLIMVRKTRKEDAEYQKMLEEYQRKLKGE